MGREAVGLVQVGAQTPLGKSVAYAPGRPRRPVTDPRPDLGWGAGALAARGDLLTRAGGTFTLDPTFDHWTTPRPRDEELTVSDHRIQDPAAGAIRERVRAAILRLAPGVPKAIQPTDVLTDDLNFDSLALLELAIELEQEFELSDFQEGAVEAKLDTVGDVEDAIMRFVGERAA